MCIGFWMLALQHCDSHRFLTSIVKDSVIMEKDLVAPFTYLELSVVGHHFVLPKFLITNWIENSFSSVSVSV